MIKGFILDLLCFIGIQFLFWVFYVAMVSSWYVSIMVLLGIGVLSTSIASLYFLIKLGIRLFIKANKKVLKDIQND